MADDGEIFKTDEETARTTLRFIIRVMILFIYVAGLLTAAFQDGAIAALSRFLVSVPILLALEFIFSSTGSELEGWAKFLQELRESDACFFRYGDASKLNYYAGVLGGVLTFIGIVLIFYFPFSIFLKDIPWAWQSDADGRTNFLAPLMAFFLAVLFIGSITHGKNHE